MMKIDDFGANERAEIFVFSISLVAFVINMCGWTHTHFETECNFRKIHVINDCRSSLSWIYVYTYFECSCPLNVGNEMF